jgi:hypothetical protein
MTKPSVREVDHLLESDPKKLIKLPDQSIYGSIRCGFKRPQMPPITDLSKSTHEILETLKLERGSKNPTSSQISKTSPSENYSYLLSDIKSLPLPSTYQKLTRLFKALDQTVNFFHYNRCPLQFFRVQDAVEKTYSFRCPVEEVQQIMSVYPESFKLSWNLIEKQVQLFIDFSDGRVKERDDLGKRRKIFDEAILDVVKGLHQDFLNKKGFLWVREDEWHPQFSILSLPSLPLAKMPEKPEVKISEVSSFVNQLVNLHSVDNAKVEDVVVEGTIDGLSPSVAAKILAKESLLKAKRMELVESAAIHEHNQGEKLFKMVEVLRTLFSTQKTPSMFLNILTNKLTGILANKNCRAVEEDLRETISHFPGFLAIIKTNSGEVVRFTKLSNFKLVDARQELKAKFNFL